LWGNEAKNDGHTCSNKTVNIEFRKKPKKNEGAIQAARPNVSENMGIKFARFHAEIVTEQSTQSLRVTAVFLG
jgi:hypothetical protein